MSDVKSPARPAATYERDFYAWTQDQAAHLRNIRPNTLDWENLAEEIESLGRTERTEIASRLNILVVHLLKWQFQPEARSYSWRGSIVEQRSRLRRVFRESPSLKTYPAQVLDEEYASARLKAAGETGQPLPTFPEACPYGIHEILDEAFLSGPLEPDIR